MSAVIPPPVGVPTLAAGWQERVFQGVLTGALGALGFFLLFSTAGTSISLFVLLILVILNPRRIWQQRFWREPVFAIGLVLLAYIGLRTFIGEGFTGASAGTLNRYHELLMVPLLWALMRMARRPQAFSSGLMAGALFFTALHWLVPLIPQLAHFLHLRRISSGFGLAVCAFLLFEHARLGMLPRWLGYGAALFLSVTVVFASDARTGHLVLIVLAACATWRATRHRWRVPAVMAMAVAAVLLGSLSQPIRHRVAETLSDAQASSKGEIVLNSSTWARIELFRNGIVVARDNWVIGTGWQGYAQVFDRASTPRHGEARPPGTLSDNPHNEYLMQLGAGGLPALVLFLLWLAAPMARALQEPNGARQPWAGAVGCVALAFAVGSLFNSLLLDYMPGHLYGCLLAWLMVRRVQD